MKNKIFFSIMSGLFLILGILLVLQNHKLRNENVFLRRIIKLYSGTNTDVDRVKEIIEKYVPSTFKKKNAPYKLVILFTPEDCPPCLEEVPFWEKYCKKEKNVILHGLINHPYKMLVEKFINDMKWQFPYSIIEEIPFGFNFGFAKTPVKVLLNNDNQVIYIEGPSPNWKMDSKLRYIVKNKE